MIELSCFFMYKYGIHDIHTYREWELSLQKLIFSSPELCSGWAIVFTFRP